MVGVTLDGVDGSEMFVKRMRSKLGALMAIVCALTAMSGCESGTASQPASSASASAAPSVSKEAAAFSSRDTDLTVINRSGRDLKVDICHDGYCSGTVTLKEGQSVKSQGVTITGWVSSAWGYGNYPIENPFTSNLGNAPARYVIDFKGFNPDAGLPYLELSLSTQCQRKIYSLNGERYSRMSGGSRMNLVEGEVLQTGANLLCSYGMVGSRSADTSDYKVMTLEVYAPLQESCWEYSPGPVDPPESPDGSWSCWPQGPRPPSTIPVAPQPK